jgi:hypothetical protein
MTDYGPKVTKITGKEIAVGPEDVARAVWLNQKYSSLTYIRRMTALYSNFVAGYEDFAKRQTENAAVYRENLTVFFNYQAALTKGIEQIERRDSTGYANIYRGCFFEDELAGRAAEGGIFFEDIGWRPYPEPPVELYAWAVVANGMCARVSMTLMARWAFPHILRRELINFPFPASLPLPAKPTGVSVQTGQTVPVSGIWMPTTPSGAPNYLWEGNDAPKAQRATSRRDYPEVIDETQPQTAYTDYSYTPEPTRWDLLWEDDRHKNGKVPDEKAAYLDPSTEPPPWPPVVSPVDPAHPKPPWRPKFRG